MAQYGQVKVTIVGYYLVSDAELENYGIQEFDPVKMAEVDQEEYYKHRDLHSIIDFFREGRATSVTFEAVDDSDVDPDC